MSYQEVFGGTNVYPADVTYLALALTGNIDLDWPMESAAPPYPMARIIDVMANGPHTMRLPDATMAAPGEVVLFNNLSVSSPCFVVDHDGVNVANLGAGEQWELYLTDNTTEAGLWQVFRFGASTATVQPSALAGYGITVTGSTLSQSAPVTTFNGTPRAVLASDRASALVWTGSGSGTLDLPGVGAVGNNFFFSARNAGGGMLSLDPLGGEVIDGAGSVSLTPGEGVVLVTDGVVWYTLGRGQSAVFAFDYIVIDIPPGTVTYVLSSLEMNQIAYKFTGALTTNVIIQVPTTVQQYWVDNRTTGAFSLSLRAGAAGVPIAVVQGSRGIYYCDGTNIIDADTSSISVPIAAVDGGTGQSVYAIGDLLVASGATTLQRLAAVPVGQLLISKGVTTVPQWAADIPIGGRMNIGDLAAMGALGHVQIFTATDPGVTPAVLSVRTSGVGGGAAVPQYLIKADGSLGGYNNASINYGVWSYSKQNVGGAAIGVYGEVPANSGTTGHGLHGKAGYNANVAYGFNLVSGVYGEVVSETVTADSSFTAAGAFQHKGTRGNLSVGVYCSTVPGSLNTQPLRCEHNGVLVFAVGPTGPLGFNVAGNVGVTGNLSCTGNASLGDNQTTDNHVINGFTTINAAGDPAVVNPAALAVNVPFPVAGSAAVPQYVAKFNGIGSNQTTIMYGVHAFVSSNVGGQTCGVYGESSLSSGNAIHHGVSGKSVYNSDAIFSLPTYLCGVYGECIQTAGAGHSALTVAGSFANKGTLGSCNIGVYGSTVAGPTLCRPFQADHAGDAKFIVLPTEIQIYSPATASAGNLHTAAGSLSSILRSSSALKYKREITEIVPIAAHKLRTLRPVQFKSRCEADDPNTTFYGFIAEEVEQAGLAPLIHYAFQEDQLERVLDDVIPGTEEDPHFKVVPKVGEEKRPDGVQYERVVVLQQLLINELYERLQVLEAKLP